MPNAPVSFTVTCPNNSSMKKRSKRFSFSVLSSVPAFLSLLVSHINNSSKTLANLTKFRTKKHTSLQLPRLICWNEFFSIVRKIRQRIFLLFYIKDLLTTGKNSWKAANSTSKGSTSNLLQVAFFNKVLWKSRNHTEIRNSSVTYLEPCQRSMTELFCVNS